MNRGDRREEIFRDDADRECFLTTLGQACEKTGWQVHAYCQQVASLCLVLVQLKQFNRVGIITQDGVV